MAEICAISLSPYILMVLQIGLISDINIPIQENFPATFTLVIFQVLYYFLSPKNFFHPSLELHRFCQRKGIY